MSEHSNIYKVIEDAILPNSIKTKAIAYILQLEKDYPEEHDDIGELSWTTNRLDQAFVWIETIQGFGFWNDIYNRINK